MSLRHSSRSTGPLAGLAMAWVIHCGQAAETATNPSHVSSSSWPSCTGFAVFEAPGNGICNHRLNNEECGYDGGDCCTCTCEDVDSLTLDDAGSSRFASTETIDAYGPCGVEGFACIDPGAECPNDDDIEYSTVLNCIPNYLGDGLCDFQHNNVVCGYDNGDCCACTCQDGPVHECGDVGYSCIDPDASCVGDNDSGSSTEPYFSYEYGSDSCVSAFFSDNDCDFFNNNEACGYDGGDCCSCTCTDAPEDDYQCGGNGFNCVDPGAPCMDGSQASAPALTLSSITWVTALLVVFGVISSAGAD